MTGNLREYKINKDANLFEETNKINSNEKKKAGRPRFGYKKIRKPVVVYLYNDEYDKLKEHSKLESVSSFIRGILKEKFNI